MNFWNTNRGHGIFDILIRTIETVFGKEKVNIKSLNKKGKLLGWTNEKAIIKCEDKTCVLTEANDIEFID